MPPIPTAIPQTLEPIDLTAVGKVSPVKHLAQERAPPIPNLPKNSSMRRSLG